MNRSGKISWTNQTLPREDIINERGRLDRLEEEARTQSLGLDYRKDRSIFRVWAPQREEVLLHLYRNREDREGFCLPMNKAGGIFQARVDRDLDGFYYTYRVGDQEVTDPYSLSASLNSRRTAIVNMEETNPPGFSSSSFVDTPPDQAIIYEVHVGDFTFDRTSGVKCAGKFLGMVEEGRKYHFTSTGLDHLKKLGITHVHLMPINDFISVDEDPEAFGREDNYNWGYDPELYNVPEGSYASCPDDPKSRIRDCKAMIQALHEAGIGVIMDVVYNHTWKSYDSNLNILAPGYYYRSSHGLFTNGSGVGNELASERTMVRKLIIDSLLFWQKEYKVDGFRFDLMALTDRETIDHALARLREVNPNILVYGEPWTGGPSGLDFKDQVRWSGQVGKGFALFNEVFRQMVKGDNDGPGKGFIQGAVGNKEVMTNGLMGSIRTDSIDGGVRDPIESINYFNAHDNLILEDKLSLTNPVGDLNDPMTRLAFGLLLTAQGIPFFHAGNEFRRSKAMSPNSYNAPYSINAVNWTLKLKHRSLYHYVRDLIQIRKDFPVFRLASGRSVRDRVRVIDPQNDNMISLVYQVDEGNHRDYLLVVHHNGWKGGVMPTFDLFRALQAYQLSIQRIFDPKGRVACNRVEGGESDLPYIHVQPLSTTIFSIKKGGSYGL